MLSAVSRHGHVSATCIWYDNDLVLCSEVYHSCGAVYFHFVPIDV